MSDLALASEQPLILHDSDAFSSELISTDQAEKLTRQKSLDTSRKEQLAQFIPPRSGLDLKSASKIALILVLATSYLTFCFIVLHRTVQIGGKGFTIQGLPSVHFTTEAGITTITILIISVALWPINGLVDEIRSEEFFRLLRSYADGVPLNSANAISAPITGPFDVILATIRRHCSGLLTSSLATTLAIIATSSLAPSALNTASVLIDIDHPSFVIGAVPQSSVVNFTSIGFHSDFTVYFGPTTFKMASLMAWAENKLNSTSAYYGVASCEEDRFRCIVPFPPGHTTTMRAYWTTDIIVLNPSCSWQTARKTGSFPDDQPWNIALSQANLYITLDNSTLVSNSTINATASVAWPFNNSLPISDGSVVFIISQFWEPSSFLPPIPDLSNVPTLPFPNGYTLAFLVCSPHASIQTKKVRSTGNGIIDLGRHQQPQGNLVSDQVNYLLSFVLQNFGDSSGPLILPGWTEMMHRLIFDSGDDWGTPAPLANITAIYKQVIQSAMKTVLSGAIDTAIVPGGSTVEQVAFKSSSGHVIASTVLFAFLTLTFVVAQFRTGREAFTLIDVAAALEDSDVPKMCREMKQLAGVSDRKTLTLVWNDDGGLNILARASTEA